VRRRFFIAVGILAGALAAATAATGAVGDLDEGTPKCISGETMSSTCELIPGATSDGQLSGLSRVEAITVSADGRSVYATGRSDHAIARFARNRRTGALDFRGCVTGELGTSCADIPTATALGVGSGLGNVRSLLVSRDGKFAYAIAADDDAVATFKRNRRGALTFERCIAAVTNTECREIPLASPDGSNSGLDHPKSATLSRDGRSLYVAATSDASVTRFTRNPRNGRLTYEGCITGETETGPSGSGACKRIPGSANLGFGSGLSDARGLAISPDQRWLYGVATDDDSIFRFQRSKRNGRLTYRGCISGDSNAACRPADDTSSGGGDTGLDQLRSLAITRDGRSVYVASRDDDGVVEFRRSLRTGKLDQKRCHSGNLGAAGGDPCISAGVPAALGEDSGLDAAEGVAVSRDGRTVYLTAALDSSVVRFRRKPATGRLTFRGCDTGDFDTGFFVGTGACSELSFSTSEGDNSGIGTPQFLALSPDDRSLYVAASADAAVFHLVRER
jgi:DNA-binding beta-propeller fold protein YncE